MIYENVLMSALCENALTSKSGEIMFGDLEIRWDSATLVNTFGDSITLSDVRFKMSVSTSISPLLGKISNDFTIEVSHSRDRLLYTHLRTDEERMELFNILQECLGRFDEANKSVNKKVWEILDKGYQW
jgi:hypothetical protein